MTQTPTFIDLTNERCPMAFVKARLALDASSPGDILHIVYENHPANEGLARSISSLGHRTHTGSEKDIEHLSEPDRQHLTKLAPHAKTGLLHTLVEVKRNK